MTLQAKLTLGTVILATLLVALISAVYLGNTATTEFEHMLGRAELAQAIASDAVKDALNRSDAPPLREALSSPALLELLSTVMTDSKEIVEVAVVTPDGEILADSFPESRGQYVKPYKPLTPLVEQGSLYRKLRYLTGHDTDYYQIEKEYGPPSFFVRVVVEPSLISNRLQKPLADSATFALYFVVGAVCLTFLFSAIAFRPLGRLRRQLDQLASGIYDSSATGTSKRSRDDVAMMASKVSLLGERLRGAEGEVSDLRGNLDRLVQRIGRQLQTADRLAAISRVSGGVAHEVKNPLNAILLHVEVARTKLAKGDSNVLPQMDIISREIARLDRVVRTFLDFTRPVELKMVRLPLETVVKEIVDLARPQAEASQIKLNLLHQADGTEVQIDRDLFKQALLNVAVNGMQAMPQGGELRIETAVIGDDTAEIRIIDTGGGIPPELREKIFRLYFTTKEHGSGIGLAMTFRIVQLHDGTIDFSSEPGKGTTFFIHLPIAFERGLPK